MFLVFSTRLRGGFAPPTTTQRVQARLATAQPRDLRLHQGVASPGYFVVFFFLGLVARFFFLSGWVGFPLPRFPPSPLFSVAFSSSGWVGSPCRVFPVFSPRFLGGLGGVSGFFLAFSCYLLHLASFSSRPKLGKHGLPTRNPPGPPRPFPWCVCPDPSPAGSRRADAPR